MKQEDKQLLIIDLCSRLPYNIQVSVACGSPEGIQWNKEQLTIYLLYQVEEEDGWEFIKPYLRPLSSMTEEEREEYNNLYYEAPIYRDSGNSWRDIKVLESIHIDWLNSHHFDYRGLLEKNLALEL